jgi:hypothetical protein
MDKLVFFCPSVVFCLFAQFFWLQLAMKTIHFSTFLYFVKTIYFLNIPYCINPYIFYVFWGINDDLIMQFKKKQIGSNSIRISLDDLSSTGSTSLLARQRIRGSRIAFSDPSGRIFSVRSNGGSGNRSCSHGQIVARRTSHSATSGKINYYSFKYQKKIIFPPKDSRFT